MVAAVKNVTKSLRMQQFNTSGEVAMGKYPDRRKSCGNTTIYKYNCDEYGNFVMMVYSTKVITVDNLKRRHY